jgi:hypothetical protein
VTGIFSNNGYCRQVKAGIKNKPVDHNQEIGKE